MIFDKVFFLYKIESGSQVYSYTNADQIVEYNGLEYEPIPISHKDVESDMSEVAKSTLTVKVGIDAPISLDMIGLYDNLYTYITVYRFNINNLQDVTIEWIGTLTKIDFEVNEMTLKFGNAIYDTQRQGLRQVYQRLCPYALYSEQCRVRKDGNFYEVGGYGFDVINDYQIFIHPSVSSVKADCFGGFVEITNGMGESYTYYIRSISADMSTITVNRKIQMPATFWSGQLALRIYRGCNKTMSDCYRKFNNSDNFGGYPLLPLENPININYKKGGGGDNSIAFKIDDENIIGY